MQNTQNESNEWLLQYIQNYFLNRKITTGKRGIYRIMRNACARDCEFLCTFIFNLDRYSFEIFDFTLYDFRE